MANGQMIKPTNVGANVTGSPYASSNPWSAGTGAGGASGLPANLAQMTQFSQDMMDPNSEYMRRLMGSMRNQMGSNMRGAQRGAAMRNVYSGGSGGELARSQADIQSAGMQGMGNAAGNMMMQAPGMGMQALGSTFSPMLGIEQMGQNESQFQRDLLNQQNQFTSQQQTNTRDFDAAQQQFQQQMDLANQQFGLQQQGMGQDQMMQMMAMIFGGM